LKKLFFALSFFLLLSPVMAIAGCVSVNLGAAGKAFCLEVADTDQARKTGLQGRRSLPRFGGMLFIFSDDAPRVMWMKDTRMTLDIIFLDNDGVVRSLASRVSPSKIKLFSPARYVIELAGGTAEKLDLWPGDKVLLPHQEGGS
jgi:hypothetical protein